MTIDESVDAVRTDYNELAARLAILECDVYRLRSYQEAGVHDYESWQVVERLKDAVAQHRQEIDEAKNRLILAVGEFLKTIGRGG